MAKYHLAHIRESECIGCTKCIAVCPVDAIVGSFGFLHQVVPDLCIGCGLCVPPCPVDCIDMIPVSSLSFDKEHVREYAQRRKERLLIEAKAQDAQYQAKQKILSNQDDQAEKQAKLAYIQNLHKG